MKTKFFTFNAFQQRCIVVWDETGKCTIIDPGFYNEKERDELFGFIRDKRLQPQCIMMTHGHFDHIFGMCESAVTFNVPIYMNLADMVIIKEANPYLCRAYGLKEPELQYNGKEPEYINIKEGEVIKVGEMEFEVIETPGHTPGGVCFLERKERILISGDTLFAGAIGRTDNQWGDYDKLIEGINAKLMILEGDIDVIPGHGPTSSIAQEGTTNPFLLPFNLPYEEE